MLKNKIFLFVAGIIFIAGFLCQVFSGRIVLPQTFTIGRITIHYYGLIMSVAVLSAWLLARKNAENYLLTKNKADDIIFWVIVAGFIGARLYHVASSFSYYLQNPIEVLKVWQGGLSIYGAVLGGLLAVLVLSKTYNPRLQSPEAQANGGQVKPITLLSWLTPSLILGQIIGRFGNLFNYELYGYPTNLPWKMFVPETFRLTSFIEASFFHPLFLYEALANFVILIFLLKTFKSKPKGYLFFSYVLLYNVARFLLEFLRVDSVFLGQLRQNALVSLVLILISLYWLVKSKAWKNITNSFQ